MTEANITLTDAAKEKITSIRKAQNRLDAALRVTVHKDGIAAYRYDLRLVDHGDKLESDQIVDSGEVQIYIDPESLERFRGATLDFISDVSGTGFKIDNPNKPPAASDPLVARVQKFFDERINPEVAGHGGHVTLLDVKDGKVYVQMGGGCQGCGMADVTLKQGIEAALKQEIPEIKAVLDSTDHDSGTNPYYQPRR
jgi:Fe/S biogenesis protein NfuA